MPFSASRPPFFLFFLRNLRPCFYQVGVCVCVCVCVCVMFSQSVALFSTALFRLSRSASRTPIRIRGHPSPLHSTGVHHLLFAPPFSSPSLRFAPSACRGLLLRSSVRPAGRPVGPEGETTLGRSRRKKKKKQKKKETGKTW